MGKVNIDDEPDLASRFGVMSIPTAILFKNCLLYTSIKVQFVDPDKNPNFISKYASDNLNTDKVLVKTEKRHRVLTVNDMFSMTQRQTSSGYDSYSMVDSALAAAIESVNLDKVPIVAVATGHNELLNSSSRTALDSLLEEENFDAVSYTHLSQSIFSCSTRAISARPIPFPSYSGLTLSQCRVSSFP